MPPVCGLTKGATWAPFACCAWVRSRYGGDPEVQGVAHRSADESDEYEDEKDLGPGHQKFPNGGSPSGALAVADEVGVSCTLTKCRPFTMNWIRVSNSWSRTSMAPVYREASKA